MIVLAIDTAGREGSVALADAGRGRFALLGLAPLAGGTYSALLIPKIMALLEAAGVSKEKIDLLAVNSGPGSFTGLRVGLATVKGLAESLSKPIVAISGLEALAVAAKLSPQQTETGCPTSRPAVGLTWEEPSHRVIVALDAQRKEVYAGEYELRGEAHQDQPDSQKDATAQDISPRADCVSERLLSLTDFIAEAAERSTLRAVYTPDATVEHALQAAGIAVETVARPRADLMARIGATRFREGKTISAEELDANYIRRSDAEIFSPSRQAK